MRKKINLKTCLVTNRDNITNKEFFNIIKQAILGNISIVQLREKTTSSKEFYEIAIKLKKLCDKYDVPLIINDRLDIAIAVNADGVHVGDEDIPGSVVRNIIGNDKILGISASTVNDAIAAEKAGADYIGTGAVYPTKSKDKEVISIERLKEVVKSVNIPVVAIGGINENNVSSLKNTGIKGVAIISAIMKSNNPKKTTENLGIGLT
ncbi:MAG: thiamine phosphate synthase [Methanobrevibacter sp.]|jgi:thiamine-phosphate pyrophosphorylase|nr:thiamine phosphate synthase [Candidatus Methanovirga basalitermitum]